MKREKKFKLVFSYYFLAPKRKSNKVNCLFSTTDPKLIAPNNGPPLMNWVERTSSVNPNHEVPGHSRPTIKTDIVKVAVCRRTGSKAGEVSLNAPRESTRFLAGYEIGLGEGCIQMMKTERSQEGMYLSIKGSWLVVMGIILSFRTEVVSLLSFKCVFCVTVHQNISRYFTTWLRISFASELG